MGSPMRWMGSGFLRITRKGTSFERTRSTGGGKVVETSGRKAKRPWVSAPEICARDGRRCLRTGSDCESACELCTGDAVVCAGEELEHTNNRTPENGKGLRRK